MATHPDGPSPPAILVTMRQIATHLGRVFRILAIAATLIPAWIWVLASLSAAGQYLSFRPDVLLLVAIVLVPAGLLWFFYFSLQSLRSLPNEVRRLVQEGRLRSSELATAVSRSGAASGWRRGWNLVRALVQLRGLVFRSRGLLVAAGMAVRLRAFNPAFLALIVAAALATVALAIVSTVATLLLLR